MGGKVHAPDVQSPATCPATAARIPDQSTRGPRTVARELRAPVRVVDLSAGQPSPLVLFVEGEPRSMGGPAHSRSSTGAKPTHPCPPLAAHLPPRGRVQKPPASASLLSLPFLPDHLPSAEFREHRSFTPFKEPPFETGSLVALPSLVSNISPEILTFLSTSHRGTLLRPSSSPSSNYIHPTWTRSETYSEKSLV